MQHWSILMMFFSTIPKSNYYSLFAGEIPGFADFKVEACSVNSRSQVGLFRLGSEEYPDHNFQERKIE
jgi:hypothetical protein